MASSNKTRLHKDETSKAGPKQDSKIESFCNSADTSLCQPQTRTWRELTAVDDDHLRAAYLICPEIIT